MYLTNLRKVGGSLMIAVPPAILEMLDIKANSCVSMSVKDGKLLIEPEKLCTRRKKYTLDSLLAQCEPAMPVSNEEIDWISGVAQGKELL